MNGETAWYLLTADETARRLGADAHAGLAESEVVARRARYGPNEIRESKRRGPWRMLADQFTDFMILILLAAAIVAGLIGDATDTVVILAIVVLNAVVGFVQEYRAERAVAALKLMAAPSATVLRDGVPRTIPAAELVPGDLVLLEAGNIVPADLRLLEAHTLRCEEAALTGESQPVDKHTRALHEPTLPIGETADATDLMSGRTSEASRVEHGARPRLVPIGDRRNMAWKGTRVTYGRGTGLVVVTGMQTELGRIAALLGGEDVKTPLQKRLARFGRVIAAAVIVLCAAMFLVGVLRGEPVALMALTAISLAVAAIPEALPAVVTVALALGAHKMVKQNALIRRLPAVETLGSATYICADKTGTLTENRMRVEELWVEGKLMRNSECGVRNEKTSITDSAFATPHSALMMALALSNDACVGADGEILGDPTEIALYRAAEAAGFRKAELAARLPRLAELPFDSERARMTTLHREDGGVIAYAKGAPESLLPLCRDALVSRGVAPLPADLAQTVERMAADGLRVLALACRRWEVLPAQLTPEFVECDLTFIGLVGLLDPPRAEAARAVQECRTAGIRAVMITGDHPATARAIAERLDIIEPGETVMTGAELARLSLPEFEREVERVRVYARVAPEQKIKIVQALQDKGEFVAMTGDGVNDAPALKRRRHRRGHGSRRHGRGARGGAHGAARRQLRDHRCRRARGPAHLRQHPQVRAFRDDRQLRRAGHAAAGAVLRAADPAVTDPHPVGEPGDRRPAGAGARGRARRARHHAPSAAAAARVCSPAALAARRVGRAAHRGAVSRHPGLGDPVGFRALADDGVHGVDAGADGTRARHPLGA